MTLVAGICLGLATGCFTRVAEAGDPASRAGLDQLFQQLLVDPGNLDLNLRYAEMAETLGNLEAAVSALDRVLARYPGAPEPRLALGLLYARLGSYDMARAYLMPLATDTATPEIAGRAREALRLVDQLASRHQFGGSLFVGVQSQTNPGALPGATNILVAGVDTLVAGNFVKHHDFDGFAKADGGYRYDLGTAFRDAIEAHGVAYASVFGQQNRLDLGLGEVSVGPRWSLQHVGVSGGDISPYLLLDYVSLGGSTYYAAYGGGLNLHQQLDGYATLSLDAQSRQANYSSSTNYPTANLLTGRIDRVTLELSRVIGEIGTLTVNGGYTRQNARAAFYASEDYVVGAGFTFGFDAGPLSLGLPWQANFSAAHHWIDYDAADPGVSPGAVRRDGRWQIGVAQIIPLAPQIAAVAQFYRDIDSSTVRNYSYTNTAFTLGLRFGL